MKLSDWPVSSTAADQSRIMQDQMTGAAMAMPPDPNKAFKVRQIRASGGAVRFCVTLQPGLTRFRASGRRWRWWTTGGRWRAWRRSSWPETWTLEESSAPMTGSDPDPTRSSGQNRTVLLPVTHIPLWPVEVLISGSLGFLKVWNRIRTSDKMGTNGPEPSGNPENRWSGPASWSPEVLEENPTEPSDYSKCSVQILFCTFWNKSAAWFCFHQELQFCKFIQKGKVVWKEKVWEAEQKNQQEPPVTSRPVTMVTMVWKSHQTGLTFNPRVCRRDQTLVQSNSDFWKKIFLVFFEQK